MRDNVDLFFQMADAITSPSPTEVARILLYLARRAEARALTYSIVPHGHYTMSSTVSFYATRKAVIRLNPNDALRKQIAQDHLDILRLGEPVYLSEYFSAKHPFDPEMDSEVRATGAMEGYMVPVYGPYQVDALVGFEFDHIPSDKARNLLTGITLILPGIHNRMVNHFFKPHQRKIELSKREQQVLQRIALGESRQEMAAGLNISPGSVDTYTRRVYQKMDVHDRARAAVTGIVMGLINL